MTDWLGSPLRSKMAMLLMESAALGPKSVSGVQLGPRGSVVMKLFVFQMPPVAPPTYTVLPVGSAGSTATAGTRREMANGSAPIGPTSVIDAGPSGVHSLCDCVPVGSTLKMRKFTCVWSATGSPSPDGGTGLRKVNDQLLS